MFHLYLAVNSTSYFTMRSNWTCTQKQNQIKSIPSGLKSDYFIHTKVWIQSYTLTVQLRVMCFTLHRSQFLRQSVIHSVTLFKQSASLSKHVNPPTSSLFPWTLAAVCHSTSGSSPGAHIHAYTRECQHFRQASCNKYPFFAYSNGTLIQ